LALDGGGIRGLLTLGILEKLEADLRAAAGGSASFRLCDYFDFIGGTSTGAILAAGLAIGKSVEELIKFYLEAGAQMFEPRALILRAWSKYGSDPLEEKLKGVFGEKTGLGSDMLKTLLLVVMRNVTTDSPWPGQTTLTPNTTVASGPTAISICPCGNWFVPRPQRRPSSPLSLFALDRENSSSWTEG
jgi:hypothetical protein